MLNNSLAFPETYLIGTLKLNVLEYTHHSTSKSSYPFAVYASYATDRLLFFLNWFLIYGGWSFFSLLPLRCCLIGWLVGRRLISSGERKFNDVLLKKLEIKLLSANAVLNDADDLVEENTCNFFW